VDDVWGLGNVIEMNYKGEKTVIIKEIYEVEIRGHEEDNNKEVEEEEEEERGMKLGLDKGFLLRVFVSVQLM